MIKNPFLKHNLMADIKRSLSAHTNRTLPSELRHTMKNIENMRIQQGKINLEKKKQEFQEAIDYNKIFKIAKYHMENSIVAPIGGAGPMQMSPLTKIYTQKQSQPPKHTPTYKPYHGKKAIDTITTRSVNWSNSGYGG